ncbi:hypothetical protein C8J56DRAFT_1047237 [Mycena floridula]|nr:hypothetical protein C8J56DRAFT_1047237 [Mycena floridula]
MSKAEDLNLSFPRSSSPQKMDQSSSPQRVRPSSPPRFPYAIVTTSNALLSRSPSQKANHSGKHSYVPTSPSPIQSKAKRPDFSSHRLQQELDIRSPSASPSSTSTGCSHSNPDLPPNPKSWTPSQLSAYLATALRVKSGESMQLPAPVARDIAGFVRETKITGKAFLRFNETDLESYGINKLWCSALLSASETLRQNVLKGRIWGFGNSLEDAPHSGPSGDEEEDGTPNNNRHLRRSSSHSYLSNPFVNGTAFYSSASSSSSMEDLADVSPVQRSSRGRYKNGRVKGMVETFERSSSFDDGPAMFVRERSGSTSSASSGLEDEDDVSSRRSTFRTARRLPTPPSFPPHVVDEEELTMEQLLALSPSANVAAISSDVTMKEKRNGSVIEKEKKRGVHAWEADDFVGVTVKRVVDNGATQTTMPARSVSEIFEHPEKVDAGVSAVEPAVDVTDASAAEEQRLKEDIDSTRTLLEQFRQRLMDVEQKIEDMEQRQLNQSAVALNEAPVPVPAQTLYQKMFGPHDSSGNRTKRTLPYDRLLDPKTISALPSYLVLVSIGVCAVVFKVLLRRTLGVAVARKP